MNSLCTLFGWSVTPLVTLVVTAFVGYIVFFPAGAADFQKKTPVIVQLFFVIALARQTYLIAAMCQSSASWSSTGHTFFYCLPLVYMGVFFLLLMVQVLQAAHRVSCRLVFLSSLLIAPWLANASMAMINQRFH